MLSNDHKGKTTKELEKIPLFWNCGIYSCYSKIEEIKKVIKNKRKVHAEGNMAINLLKIF